MNTLHLGRPEFCQGSLPSNLTFDDNSSPRINIVLCGTPQPTLEGEFIGQKLNIFNMTIDSYTHNYTLQLPKLTQISCGKELKVRAIGNDGVIADETKVFVKNCKYEYCIHVILALNLFLDIFGVTVSLFVNIYSINPKILLSKPIKQQINSTYPQQSKLDPLRG